MKSWLAVACGASCGAWLRWGLSVLFNQGVHLPLGTFLANALGGWLMGWSLAWLQQNPDLSPEWRLLITTGFLGGLTTFSTFSAEAMALLQRQWYAQAVAYMLAHVLTSIALTLLGYWWGMRVG